MSWEERGPGNHRYDSPSLLPPTILRYVCKIISAVVGKEVTDVGYGLESQTSDIKEYDFLMKNGLHVTLVDTPGFNDSGGKSDAVILKEIGAFLKAK